MAAAIFLAGTPVQSQDQKQTRIDEQDVIKVTSNRVNFDVMVKDKKGKAITDLKAEDFVLSENGVRQKIEFFDSALSTGNDPGRPGTISVSTGPRPPSSLPRNIIALVLDGQTTEGANLKHVRDGMMKYIRERMSNSDSVALFAISGGLQRLQPFTQDKAKLISAVEKSEGISTTAKTPEQRGLNDTMAALRDQLATLPNPGAVDTPAMGSMAAQAMISQRVLEQYVQLRWD